jgi:ABC-type antimicrobial peptide transport system permease subunit
VKATRTLNLSLRALRRNPMRATLTALGIIIGVGSVIAMMEIGTGSSAAIQKSISSMGANNLMIMPGTAASGGVSFGAGSTVTLTPQDYDAIVKECPAIRVAAPLVRARSQQLIRGGKNWVPMQIFGTTAQWLDVRDWKNLSEGDVFTDRDVRNANRVCVIGQTIAKQLFENESPVGQDIRVQNITFRVVGVLSRKGANMMGMDQDDLLIAPWTTIKYRVSGSPSSTTGSSASSSSSSTSVGDTYPVSRVIYYPDQSSVQTKDSPMLVRFTSIDQIIASAVSVGDIQLAIKQITAVLRQRHRLGEGVSDDFQIRDMTEMSSVMTQTTSLMTTLLLAVAMISLIVGGVGIMNIMLVSVTERTREIGLRMAVGARSRDILRQFLIEAIVLCVTGGIIGIILGCASSYLVTLLLHWPTQTSIGAIAASVLVSATVGIVFGYYPAWKAAKLDPIEALRYE